MLDPETSPGPESGIEEVIRGLRVDYKLILRGTKLGPSIDKEEWNCFQGILSEAREIFENRRVMVIGLGGIGGSFGRLAARAGARKIDVVGLAEEESSREGIESLGVWGRRIGSDVLGEIIQVDFSQAGPDGKTLAGQTLVKALEERPVEELPDIVLITVGIGRWRDSSADNLEIMDDVHKIHRVNFLSPVDVTVKLTELFHKHNLRDRTITALGSNASEMPAAASMLGYPDSKAALRSVYDQLALDYMGKYGVRLLIFGVGSRSTGFQKAAGIPVEDLPGKYKPPHVTVENIVDAWFRKCLGEPVHDWNEKTYFDRLLSEICYRFPNLALLIFDLMLGKVAEKARRRQEAK